MAAAARPNHLLCWRTQASFDAMTCRAFVLGVETDAKMFYAVDRATTADLTGAVRRRQGFVSRRGVDRPRGSGADARCAPRVEILCHSGSVPGSRVSARSFGPCARPGSRLARASVATGRRAAVLAVVSARHAPVCCCLVIHAPWRARAETGNLASVSITGACARQISWGIGVLQPPRCPWPHQRHTSRRSRPRPDDYFPSTHAHTRVRWQPLSSRVTDFGDRNGGVSPEDTSGAAGRGWQDAAATRGRRQDATPERHFGFWGRLVGGQKSSQATGRGDRDGGARRRTRRGGRQDTTAMAWGQRGRRCRQGAGHAHGAVGLCGVCALQLYGSAETNGR